MVHQRLLALMKPNCESFARTLPYKYLVYELSFSSNKFLAVILHAEKCQVKEIFSEILLRLSCFSCDGRLALSYHLASSFPTKLPLSHAN